MKYVIESILWIVVISMAVILVSRLAAATPPAPADPLVEVRVYETFLHVVPAEPYDLEPVSPEPFFADEGGVEELEVEVLRSVKVTAYCPCEICCERWSRRDSAGRYVNHTASGVRVSDVDPHFVAAPRSIPFGMMLRVPGYNGGDPVPVRDRGGAIHDRDGLTRLDLYFPTHRQALAWGVRYLDVEIVN